jgi:hypothetical protein
MKALHDRILLSDAVIAALVNAGATTEILDAARAAAWRIL